MNFLKKSIYAVSLMGMAGLWSCSQDEMLQDGNQTIDVQTVRLTLTVNRGDTQTRTVLTENNKNGGLTSEWEEGDILYVYNTNGDKVGSLTIVSGWESSVGVFSGTVEGVTDGEYVSLFHHNVMEGLVSEEEDDNAKYLKIDLSEQGFSSVSDLAELDILTSADPTEENPYDIASVQLSVKEDGTATVMKDVTLKSKLAFARFSLSGLDEGSKGNLYITDVDGNLYVNTGLAFGNTSRVKDSKSADGMKIADVEAGKDVYVAFVPNAKADVKGYTLKLRFVNDSDGKEYTYQFEKPTTLEAGKYYNSFDESEGSISGIAVSMVPETSTEPVTPVVDEDLVGKMFEVNGKKFRFTRGNLKYNTETGEWSLMDNQYDFICKAGWTLSNGTWASGKTKETEIDLYGFGATGLYDIESNETAQAPTFWRQTADQTYSLAAYYYPTNNTTTNMGSGFIGSNLEHGTQFTNFDWGKAYQLNKSGEAYPSAEAPYTSYDKEKHPDVLRYFTLSSDDWSKLQSKYFMCGATITGIANTVNTAAKNNIYGCLIFPIEGEGKNSAEINNYKLAKVKELLEGKATYTSSKLSTNLSFTGTNYKYFDYSSVTMTSAQFEELEKLGVVFLPEAGHRATDSYTKTDGYYWTSTAGQQYVSTFFRFDGDSSPHVFKLEGLNRSLGGSVRLVKEVPEDYEDPEVVD